MDNDMLFEFLNKLEEFFSHGFIDLDMYYQIKSNMIDDFKKSQEKN